MQISSMILDDWAHGKYPTPWIRAIKNDKNGWVWFETKLEEK